MRARLSFPSFRAFPSFAILMLSLSSCSNGAISATYDYDLGMFDNSDLSHLPGADLVMPPACGVGGAPCCASNTCNGGGCCIAACC